MYNKKLPTQTTLIVNTSYEGETIEQKINRIVNNKEPIKDGAPIIYTDRKEGVQPQFDIRTDRFELAVEATDHITKTHLGKRQSAEPKKDQTIGEQAKDGMKKEGQNPANTSDGQKN